MCTIQEYSESRLDALYKLVEENNRSITIDCNCSLGFQNEVWLVGEQYTNQDIENGNIPDPLYLNTETCPDCGRMFVR